MVVIFVALLLSMRMGRCLVKNKRMNSGYY
jgi:hypothetical protein